MIKFGPSGNSPSFYEAGYKNSLDAPKWLNQIGLNAYEFSFGRGYTMSKETALKLGEQAKINKIEISIHAPFYINLANPDNDMKIKSINYILKGLEFLKDMNGQHLVAHLSSQGKMSREEALLMTSRRLDECLEKIYFNNLNSMFLCPETMGKPAQIGDYKEIVDFCSRDKILLPTFDFGHINALTQGALKTKNDYKKILDYGIEKLGLEKIKKCHIHFSKIEFGKKGEIRHLNYNDKNFGPDFEPLAEILIEYNLEPTIICESRDFMAEDALILKNIFYNKLNLTKI